MAANQTELKLPVTFWLVGEHGQITQPLVLSLLTHVTYLLNDIRGCCKRETK